MSRLLCFLWPYLAGGLIAWLICGRLAHKLKYQQAPRERIVEKVVEKIVEVEVSAPPDAAGISPVLSAAESRIAALEARLSALGGGKEPDPDRAFAAGFTLGQFPDADDLTVVEGVGPRVCEVLHAAGIRRFIDLAGSSVEHIESTLGSAGARFSLARPATWPAQAALAATNQWEALKAWQDVLDGGEEVES